MGTQFRDLIKPGADLMVVGALNKWTPPRKKGGIPLVSARFSLSMEKGQTDAGRDGRTSLARPNSQTRTGTGRYPFSLFSSQRAVLATLPG